MFSLFSLNVFCKMNHICFPLSTANIFIFLFMAGLESAKSGNYDEAFTCFVAAAQQGYSKAQFNTGVCYEKGRGVSKDKEKVRIQTAHLGFLSASSFWKSSHLLFSYIRNQCWDDSHVFFFSRLCITTGRQQLGVTGRLSTAMQSCSSPAGGTRV